jgi:hypothetical protein
LYGATMRQHGILNNFHFFTIGHFVLSELVFPKIFSYFF